MVGIFIYGVVAGLLACVVTYGTCVAIQTIRALPDDM